MQKIALALLLVFVMGICATASAQELGNVGLVGKLTIVFGEEKAPEPKEPPPPPKEEEHHKKKQQPKPPEEKRPEQPPEEPGR